MAPRETPKVTAKVQRNVKDLPTKGRASPAGAIKKTVLVKKTQTVEKTPLKSNSLANKVNLEARTTRQRTSTVPKAATPKPKENKAVPIPSSVTKSGKKPSWKRRPMPAHSGVPVPEKMKKLLEKQFLDPKFAL